MTAVHTTAPRRSLGQTLGLPALAAGLAVAAYLSALHNPFAYDDHSTILANPSLTDLGNWRFVLVYSLFRPVVNLSYALDYAAWGLRPFGYHLTSLALHAVNVWLVYGIARSAAQDHRAAAGRGGAGSAELLAFATAALFAVHPLMTEAVGYVSGRSEVLCGTFFLAALRLMRRGFVTGRWPWLAGGWLAFLLALASKEVAVMFPFVLFAYERLLLPGTPAVRRRRLWRVHAPLAALVVVAAVARLATLLLAERPIPTAPWLTLLVQATVVVRYVGMLVLPIGQSIVHPVRPVTGPFDARALAAIVGLLAAAGVAIGLRRRAPIVTFGVCWFLFVLVPSSSAVALRESMAEHRVYLASAGVFLLAGAGIARLAAAGPPGWRRVGVPALLAAGLAGLGWLTVERNRVWASPVSLWADAALNAPTYWEPHYSLGDVLRESGRCGDAIEEYRIVVQLRPIHRDAFNNLGICLAQTGRVVEARGAFERTLAIDPTFARAHNNLGGLALLERDPETARREFEQALALDSGNLVARRQLAALYETTFGKPAEAARLCREIQALAPLTPGVAECIARNEARLRQAP